MGQDAAPELIRAFALWLVMKEQPNMSPGMIISRATVLTQFIQEGKVGSSTP